MQPSAAFAALLAFAASTIAAPTPATNSLVPRGRILHQIAQMGGDTRQLVCHIKEAFECYAEEIHDHMRIIKADIKEDFEDWKLDVEADFAILLAELKKDIGNFEVKFEIFTAKLEAAIFEVAVDAAALAELLAFDIRFHIAYIWEHLHLLEDDIRAELYALLEDLSFSIHTDLSIHYTKYSASCTGVLTQIKTVDKYYHKKIDIEVFLPKLLKIHRTVEAATHKTKTTVFRSDRLNDLN